MSRAFFPLRMGVEMFAEHSSISAVGRAKEAAVLFDELIFEAGAVDVAVTQDSVFDFWVPPDQLTSDQRERARHPVAPGTKIQFSLTPLDSPDDSMTITSALDKGFVSEYHTGILDELAEFKPDWVRTEYTGNTASASHLGLRELERSEALNDFTNPFMKTFALKSFDRDIATAIELGASVSITPMFSSIASHLGMTLESVGGDALGIAVPDLRFVPWEGIMSFREHPACEEARANLAQFESLARAESAGDAVAYLENVAGYIVSAYRAALADERKSWPTQLAEQAAEFGVSMIPVAGPIASKIFSAGLMVGRETDRQRSWTSALLKLAPSGP